MSVGKSRMPISFNIHPSQVINDTIFPANKKESNYCFSKKIFAAALGKRMTVDG
jgi:hypothetical protein